MLHMTRFHLFYGRVIFHYIYTYVCVYHNFFIHLSIDGYLDYLGYCKCCSEYAGAYYL